MTKTILIILIISFFTISCNEKPQAEKFNSLGINFRIIPEYNDGTYYVEWKDTLGQKNGFDQFNRPLEVWCIVKNLTNDTIGYYKGLSTPQKMSYFTTTDSIVSLEFKVGINTFSEVYYNQSEKENKKLWNFNAQRMTDFEPIELNIKRDLRKEQNIVLNKKN